MAPFVPVCYPSRLRKSKILKSEVKKKRPRRASAAGAPRLVPTRPTLHQSSVVALARWCSRVCATLSDVIMHKLPRARRSAADDVGRLSNLKFSGSRGGSQQRELRSGGMEFLGDDEHHAILDNLRPTI